MQVVSPREEFQWLLLLVVGFLLSLLPEYFLWIGCLSLVLIVGLPHGALDIYLLWFKHKKDPVYFLRSLLKYLCWVLGSLVLWRCLPEVFWGFFFAAAIYHFGSADEHPDVVTAIMGKPVRKVLWVLSRGTLLVFTPVAFHAEEMTHYLRQAAPLSFAKQLSALAPFLCAYAGIVFVVTTFTSWRKATMTTYRWLLVKHASFLLFFTLLFAVTEPLLGFSLYFCFHHSLTHAFRVWGRCFGKVRGPWIMFWATVTTLLAGPLFWWIPNQAVLDSAPEGRVTAAFVVIAALTFPHLVVVKEMYPKLTRRFCMKEP